LVIQSLDDSRKPHMLRMKRENYPYQSGIITEDNSSILAIVNGKVAIVVIVRLT
jgi:hypothetical protein